MALYKNSRYIRTNGYIHDDTLILSIRSRPNYGDDVSFYTVLQGDTLDGIAYDFYRNTQLKWAILDANPVYQSELEIKPGDVIMIPNYDRVLGEVNE